MRESNACLPPADTNCGCHCVLPPCYDPSQPHCCCPIVGPPGRDGAPGTAAECFCVSQLRHVLEQLRVLYPNDRLIVSTESGESLSGHINALLPAQNANGGLLELRNAPDTPLEAVSLCRIAAVCVTGATYRNAITYLTGVEPPPEGCEAECQAALRAYLPIGTRRAVMKAGGRIVARGRVLKNEAGMLVLVGINDSNPTFVSLCKTEVVRK